MKKALKNILARLIVKLKLIYEQNKLKILYNNPNVIVGKGLAIEEYFSATLPADDFSIKFGSYVHFKKHCSVLVLLGAELVIGDGVFFNNHCSINCIEKISIGENTQFGEGVKLYDHNHLFAYKNNALTIEKDKFKTAPITIGKNCWIGSNVTILKGVSIGDNVIIGANNLVYKSVPPNTVLKFKADYIIENYLD